MRWRTYSALPGSPPSVTSILAAAWPKPDLTTWLINESARLARDHPDAPIKAQSRFCDQFPSGGRQRGSRVHKAIETHIAAEHDPEDLAAQNLAAASAEALDGVGRTMLSHWRTWWEQHPQRVLGTEMTIWEPSLPYAGTLDLLSLDQPHGTEDHPDEALPRVLTDWKTASTLPDEPYLDHVAQCAAYALGSVELPGPNRMGQGTTHWDLIGALQMIRVVYISAEGVRCFEFGPDSEVWGRAVRGWRACCDLATQLWPETFRHEVAEVQEATLL